MIQKVLGALRKQDVWIKSHAELKQTFIHQLNPVGFFSDCFH